MLCTQFWFSERVACRVVGEIRNTQRLGGIFVTSEEFKLRRRLEVTAAVWSPIPAGHTKPFRLPVSLDYAGSAWDRSSN
jgi:hypothetical protein